MGNGFAGGLYVILPTINKTIILYDDNERLRQSLEMMLSELSGYRVTGSFSHCNNIREDLIKSGCPDIVIMDIDMPGMSGIQGVQIFKELCPSSKILMFTVFEEDDRIFESICNGADGYILKSSPPLKIIQSLQELMEGGVPMSPFVAQRVFGFFRNGVPVKDYQLTSRETEILTHLVKGLSYKMIAAECFITMDTVKKHLQNIYYKLQVSCGTEAVAKALREKIIRF
jgi:DNA-binding NarL/FixJ family response regulator